MDDMPKIHTIASDQVVNGADKLLGTDSTSGSVNATKNYTLDSIKNFIQADAASYAFKTFAITGQDDIVADNSADTLTFVGGGSVAITANTSTDTITITGTDTDTTYTAGVGLNLADTEFSVDGTVVRTSGNQTINDVKTFTSNIVGDITGNAATVTDGVYTTGDQTIGGFKTFSQEVKSDTFAFTSTLGKIKETSVTISSVDLTALNGGGEFTLIPAGSGTTAIIPVSVTIKVDPGVTAFDFTQDLYIGHQNQVSTTSTDYFALIGASFINATTIAFRHLPFSKGPNEHVDILLNAPLVLHAPIANNVTQGDGDLVVNILYRELDLS